MISLGELIGSYTVSEVNEMVDRCASDIDTVADVLDINRNYLSIQVRLHVPYYEAKTIENCKDASIVREILKRLRASLDSFGEHNRNHRLRNGIDDVPAGARVEGRAQLAAVVPDAESVAIRFGEVSPDVGLAIQEELHYIHKARKDTRYHFGLFVDGRPEPICYAAFSELDRQYLWNALEAKGLLGGVAASRRIAVMTRAFGFSPLPSNAMSKLFDRACRRLNEGGFGLVVTAVNPFLSFRGSTFSGSSFIPFATSPMRYWYSADGRYLNRRCSDAGVPQRFDTPPILWLVRGLHRTTHRPVEKLDYPLYEISMEEYANG